MDADIRDEILRAAEMNLIYAISDDFCIGEGVTVPGILVKHVGHMISACMEAARQSDDPDRLIDAAERFRMGIGQEGGMSYKDRIYRFA